MRKRLDAAADVITLHLTTADLSSPTADEGPVNQ
jgi:hypothetical protein